MFAAWLLLVLFWPLAVSEGDGGQSEEGRTLPPGSKIATDQAEIDNHFKNLASACVVSIEDGKITLRYNEETASKGCTVEFVTEQEEPLISPITFSLQNADDVQCLKGPGCGENSIDDLLEASNYNIMPFVIGKTSEDVELIRDGPLYLDGALAKCEDKCKDIALGTEELWKDLKMPNCMPWTAFEIGWSRNCESETSSNFLRFLGSSEENYLVDLAKDSSTTSLSFANDVITFKDAAGQGPDIVTANIVCFDKASILRPKIWNIVGPEEFAGKKSLVLTLLPRQASRMFTKAGLAGKLSSDKNCATLQISFDTSVYSLLLVPVQPKQQDLTTVPPPEPQVPSSTDQPPQVKSTQPGAMPSSPEGSPPSMEQQTPAISQSDEPEVTTDPEPTEEPPTLGVGKPSTAGPTQGGNTTTSGKEAASTEKSGGVLTYLIVGIVVALLLVGGGIGVFFFIKSRKSDTDDDVKKTEEGATAGGGGEKSKAEGEKGKEEGAKEGEGAAEDKADNEQGEVKTAELGGEKEGGGSEDDDQKEGGGEDEEKGAGGGEGEEKKEEGSAVAAGVASNQE